MSHEKVLQQVAKGAGLLFVGMIISDVIKFIYRVILSRYLGPSDYGLVSIGEGVLNIALLFSVLGLQLGAVKFIAQFIGEDNLEKIKGTIRSTFRIIIPASVVITTLIIIFSQYISIGIFHETKLIPIIIIFALSVPFASTNNTLASIFVALKRIDYWTYLSAFVRPFSLILFTLIIIFLEKDVTLIALASLFSYAISGIFGMFLLEFKTISVIRSKIEIASNYKELLSFSFPLFLSGVFVVIMGWIDTFFLGALRSSAEAGIYSIAFTLVNTLTVLISAFASIFLPISSELQAKKEFIQMAKIYEIISRWMFLLCFPILLIILVFPKDILTILYGSSYSTGYIALQILIIGTFTRAILGPAPKVLMVFDKTKILFYTNIIAATINILLNYLLIPKYSLIGAASATLTSLLLRDIALFILARKNIHFTYPLHSYFKYFISAIIPLVIIFIISKYITVNLFTLLGIIIIYIILYALSLVLFKSFTKDDIIIIEAVEKKTGVSLAKIKKIIS